MLAQLGEHLPYKQGVTGSSPVGPITFLNKQLFGEIAQLARARGSYPRCRRFESPSRYFCAYCNKIEECFNSNIRLWRDSSSWLEHAVHTRGVEVRIPLSLLFMQIWNVNGRITFIPFLSKIISFLFY